ncbi:uncharacterized protein LOC136078065 [Hydra vulgaris]|uniref:Uncharacterized protein LOC136078065 n=1 Tax=Hydra vulgaris TaxID=6087 RepID=A0ABM4BIS9_HYDVU
MKSTFRKIITEWKIGEGRFHTSLPKNVFPRLLLNLLTNMNHIQEFAVTGFKTSGIYPLNRKKIIDKNLRTDISKSSQNLVSPLFFERLAELRQASAKKPGAVVRGEKVKVSPGKSVSLEDVATGSSASKFQSKHKLIKIKNTQLNESLNIERQERNSKLNLNTFKELIDYDIPSSSKMYIDLQEASDKKSDGIQKEKSEILKKKDLFTEKSNLYDDYDLEDSLFHQKQAHMQKKCDNYSNESAYELDSLCSKGMCNPGVIATSEYLLAEGSYVVVRFEGKKTPYHFVGQVVNIEKDNNWNIKYFRRDFDTTNTSIISFKEPQVPDYFVTERKSIIKHLPEEFTDKLFLMIQQW